MARAFLLMCDDEEVGYIGVGPGPFISAAEADLPHPWLEHVRFTSFDISVEPGIARVLEQATSLEEAAGALRAQGYILEEIEYERVFQAPNATPPTHANAAAAHIARRVREMKDSK